MNIGFVERVIRILVGAALLSCVFLVPNGLRWAGLIGLLPFISGLIGWCPFYACLNWLTLD
jgi:hypothetical protein